jgi:hypothetical protein
LWLSFQLSALLTYFIVVVVVICVCSLFRQTGPHSHLFKNTQQL